MSDCVFCKIRDGEIPARLVMRDEHCFAFDDITPQAPVHVLFVPLRHIPSNTTLTPDDEQLVGHLVLQAGRIAAERGIASSGFRLAMNSGPDACQSVFHLHLHLMGGRQLQGSMG